MARIRPDYSDDIRATVVAMLNAEGYPRVKGSLTKVSSQFGIPPQTIGRWFRGENNPPISKDVHKKEFDLAAALRAELEAIIPLLDTKRKEATYQQLVTATGILTDKTLLLEGKMTSRDEVIIRVERD